MKLKWLMVTAVVFFAFTALSAQGLSGEFKLDGVHVQYYDVSRDSGAAAADSGSVHGLVLSWPSAAAPMFQYPVADYPPGDTVASPETPEYLTTPEGLELVGIDLTITLNDNGTFGIPMGSTYPTTETNNCSTTASIPVIQDAGNYEWDGNDVGGGFGILTSEIFDLFSKIQTDENHGWININRNASNEITDFILEWVAVDGNDSESGIDNSGNLERQLGIAELPSDTGFVAGLNAAYGLDLPVGDLPTAGENWEYDGEMDANWVYLFDPAGLDAVPFSGDEPLMFTSYYFTYNDMAAIGIFTGAFGACYGGGGTMDSCLAYAANATLVTYGVDSTLAAGVSTLVYDYVDSLLTAGVELDDALVAGMVYSIGAAMQGSGGTWSFPDDSDHDYNPTDGDGRLVFEMGNQCIPDLQTREVWASFHNTDPDVSIDNEGMTPKSFALLGNYPNPFNPSTNIVFDLDASADVTVKVYSLLGQEINTIYQTQGEPGRYTVPWHGNDYKGNAVPTGIYFYRIKADNRVLTGKMLMLK